MQAGPLCPAARPATWSRLHNPTLLPVDLFAGGTLRRLTQDYGWSVAPSQTAPDIEASVNNTFDPLTGNTHWCLHVRYGVVVSGEVSKTFLDLETGDVGRTYTAAGGTAPPSSQAFFYAAAPNPDYARALTELRSNLDTFINPPNIPGYDVVTELKPYAAYVDAELARKPGQ